MATMLIRSTLIRFNKKPARIIWGIVKRFDENTIALGGVATGSMKAQLAAKVIGTHSTNGLIPASTANAPMTGKNVAVVATLLVSSVKKITNKVATTTNTRTP